MSSPAPALTEEQERPCSICGSPTAEPSGLCGKCAKKTPQGTGTNPLVWCKKHERSIRQWSHSIGNFAQVIALVLVGFWTIRTYNHAEDRFSHMEEPSLKPHLRTGVNLEWKKIPNASDRCMAELTLLLENPSKQSIEITQMHLKGFLTTVQSKAHPPFIPDEELSLGTPFFDKTWTQEGNYLLGPLQPSGKVDDSFLFQFKNDPTKRVWWEAEFKTAQDLGYRPWASQWDFVCNYRQK